MDHPLRIVLASAELAPFSKVGGQGDVAHALPKHLQFLGHEPIVVAPYYQFIDDQSLVKELVGERAVRFGKTEYVVKFLKTALSPVSPVPVYFIYQEELFSRRLKVYGYDDDNRRFAFFNYAVLALLEHLQLTPDIIHCHEWHAGLIPNLLRTTFAKNDLWRATSTVFTIHNLHFQSHESWLHVPVARRDRGRGAPPTDGEKLRYLNFTLRGIKYADAINTVSERYSQEILTKKFGEGLDGALRRRRDRVFGIINGVDYTIFNPSFDQHLDIHYDWNSLDKKMANKTALQKSLGLTTSATTPLIGMAHRLSEQKGFNLIMEILPSLLRRNVQFVAVGEGERGYMRYFRQVAKKYPTRVGVHLKFSEPMASRIYAASDMFLMPSRFEPCGISQLISLRYGSIPIVHKTGGLSDTIQDFDPRTGEGTGFVFYEYTAIDLLMAITRAIETYQYPKIWEHLTWQAMRQSFSWSLPARKYADLYAKAVHFHHALD